MVNGENLLKAQIEEAFGKELTAKQLWALVNLSKRVRLRARNNSAFNNLFGRLFPNARFRQVTKIDTRTGRQYPGLQITVNGETVDADDTEE